MTASIVLRVFKSPPKSVPPSIKLGGITYTSNSSGFIDSLPYIRPFRFGGSGIFLTISL